MIVLPFATMTFTQAHDALRDREWTLASEGDFAWVMHHPDATHIARLSPFDPAYTFYIRSCHAIADNPFLPHIESEFTLADGGHITFCPLYHEAPEPLTSTLVKALANRNNATLTGKLIVVQTATLLQDLAKRANRDIPYFGGIDLTKNNILMDKTGQLKLTDPLTMNLETICRDMLHETPKAIDYLGADTLARIMDIPFFRRRSNAKRREILLRRLKDHGIKID